MSGSLGLTLTGLICLTLLGADAPTTGPAVSVPPPVPGYPIGWCIRAKSEAFAQAKAMNYEYVELALQDVLSLSDADFDKLAADLRAAGLPAMTGYNSIPKEIRIVGPEVDQAKIEEHLKKLLVRAAVLKLKYLVFNAGASWKIPDGFAPDLAFTQLTDFCRRYATEAAKSNITVLVQPLRSTDSNQITTIADAIKLVEAVNHPNFAMLVDYSFLAIQKDNPAALLKNPKALRHVWISNPANNRSYAMADSESDYASFFKALKEIGYRGGISVHGGSKDIPADAPKAIAFLRGKASELAAGH